MTKNLSEKEFQKKLDKLFPSTQPTNKDGIKSVFAHKDFRE